MTSSNANDLKQDNEFLERAVRAFSDLDHRLYNIQTLQFPLPYANTHLEYIITSIERNIFDITPVQALDLVQSKLDRISALERRIDSLVTEFKIPPGYFELKDQTNVFGDHVPNKEIKKKIRDSLKKELSYYTAKLKQMKIAQEERLLDYSVANIGNTKLQLNITVKQLGALFRLLQDTGLVVEKNRSKLADQVAACFLSSKEKSPSARVILKAMYDQIDAETFEFWQKHLPAMKKKAEEIMGL